MEVDERVDRVEAVLEGHVVDLRAEVVAEMRRSRGLDAGEDALEDARRSPGRGVEGLAHGSASVADGLSLRVHDAALARSHQTDAADRPFDRGARQYRLDE